MNDNNNSKVSTHKVTSIDREIDGLWLYQLFINTLVLTYCLYL
jgi:hypothetical protein